MRILPCVGCLLVIVAASASRPAHAEGEAPPAKAQDDRARFSATFRFVGGASEEAGRRDAIDHTVDRLFFAIRGVARARLASRTKIAPWVSFAFGDGKIRVRVPSGPEVSSPEQGGAAEYVSEGERVRVSQRLSAGKLSQVFAADDGTRTNEWTLAADGNTLLLKVTVASAKLSTPLVYRLTYRRS